jgi:DNA-binding NarL/FixJ family response regulator
MPKRPEDKKPLRILIVDDVELQRVSLKALLEFIIQQKKEIEFAATGEEAIKKLGETDFDIIFLDNTLPGRNGFSVLQEKQIRGLKGEVIFISGHDEEEFIEKARRLGARYYLTKGGMDMTQLTDAVNAILYESPYIVDDTSMVQNR